MRTRDSNTKMIVTLHQGISRNWVKKWQRTSKKQTNKKTGKIRLGDGLESMVERAELLRRRSENLLSPTVAGGKQKPPPQRVLPELYGSRVTNTLVLT